MDNGHTSENSLDSNKNDLAAALAKASLGTIPYAGGFLAEIVGNVIPNQRVDRIAKFCIELDQKIKELPSERTNSLLKNEEFIDFLEESFIQVSRAFTNERKDYILNIIINGIKDDTLKIIESKHLLKLLNELNDIEIIWLRYTLDPTITGDTEFREKHSSILTKVYTHVNCDEQTLVKASMQQSYSEHLSRLGLTEERIKLSRETGQPTYNKTTGKVEARQPITTNLGKLLLKHIGLIDSLVNERI
ncbi:hypothetical protein [Flavobacterium sp. F52]|uniref:hypothetical protein n=1 Tax=Flavobacterium sp. F52 TaxID=1202532 RepID=UPI000272D85D|nr:hypothetical protein [Flavobacterium sp. F52]EJG03164.1 hypothetical protein FF52_03190 [Flavobacterium sp. F52]